MHSSILFYRLASFVIFIILQGLFINGVYESFQEGMVLSPVKKFLSLFISEFFQLPLFGCIRCMASWWGTVTFMPTVIYLYGFHWVEIPIQVFDIFVLCFVNFFIYKKV